MVFCLFISIFVLYLSQHMKVKKNAKIKNRYNQVPHLTQDTIWESDKTSHTREPRSQSFPSRWPQVCTRTFGTYCIVEQRRIRPVCTNAQTRHSLHCSHTHCVDIDSDQILFLSSWYVCMCFIIAFAHMLYVPKSRVLVHISLSTLFLSQHSHHQGSRTGFSTAVNSYLK